MNERIRELYIQAIHATKHDIADDINVQIAEKFAEQIVRECDRYARSAWEHGPLLGKDLLIHFGIEKPDDVE